jgi:hypothetical protein
MWGLAALIWANVYELNVIKKEFTARAGPFMSESGNRVHLTSKGLKPDGPGYPIYQNGKHVGNFQITLDSDE